MKRNRLTVVSVLHYIRLVYRSALFVILLIGYISYRINEGDEITSMIEQRPLILVVTWAVFVCEMVLRFFPSRFESPGCQKQFKRNYIKSGSTDIDVQDNNATVLVALIWIIFNGCIGALRMLDVLDEGILILLCSAYSVCDMICILFFCPFQTWFLKNKCCTACPIYNWDYAMMFTPLAFLPGLFTWSLLAMGLVLLIVWEVRVRRYPERFSEATNQSLGCDRCQEKLCHHKRQLRRFWEKQRLRISGR